MELLIKETLEKLLDVLNVSYTGVKINKEGETTYYVEIETEHSNILIGWHGETISALQHLLKCLLWKQGIDSRTQVIIDVDGYKKRQEESVIKLAERKAEYAIETQKEIKLPPMNPYFRRKVHTHLANSDKYKDVVTTESVGVNPDRAVKIIPK
ncbi:KH domain-containing protein [Patescibacteria group bacterium]|nr:KH domain-containing protein [Patescibacteria group bacterium]MBU1682824.1 KH domain-containing protein [Patescibacteria group bacterium]